MYRKPTILKVNLEEDIRRVSLAANSFVELQKQVAELFSIQEGAFSLKYKDDEGDMISICSEEEYREALACCTNDILRIYVAHLKPKQPQEDPKAPNKERKHPRCHRGQWRRWRRFNCPSESQPTEINNTCGQQPQQQMLPNLLSFLGPLQHLASNLLQNGQFDELLGGFLNSDFCKLEHNHVCDGCETQISGTRYHCKQCPDFDFCSTCYQEKLKTHFSDHQFEEITALQAFKQALSNNEGIDAFVMPGSSTQPVPKNVHNAFCDRCNEKIVGIRWKCLDCEDFDFCNACYVVANGVETINSHLNTHLFGKIEDPQNRDAFTLQRKEHLTKKLIQLEKEKQEQLERLEKEKQEKERLIQLERERLEREKLEKQRLEKLERERLIQLEKERLERERLEKQNSEKKILYPFEKKLEDLASMGFNDRPTNIRLLIKNKGDVIATIQDLIGN